MCITVEWLAIESGVGFVRLIAIIGRGHLRLKMHNQMSPDHYTITILHELWHVYQHVKGALKDKYGKRYWRGVDCSEMNYEDQPWEVQAHQMEEVLFQEYLDYLTNTNQSL